MCMREARQTTSRPCMRNNCLSWGVIMLVPHILSSHLRSYSCRCAERVKDKSPEIGMAASGWIRPLNRVHTSYRSITS